MKKIITKAIMAIILGILMTKELEAPFWIAILFIFMIYSALSWFGMIYRSLYAFGGVLRTIISLVGSILIFAAPAMILELLLPENWIRTVLTAIGFITLFLIPFVGDWKEYRAERM